MILSQTAVYALRAMLCLAENDGKGPLRVDDIATDLDVPRNYLSKILHVLARAGLLDSTRGPGGGFQLARPTSDFTLLEIVQHFDDIPSGSECLLGREQCSDADPCAAHQHWKGVSAQVRDFFKGTTLADLSRDAPLMAQVKPG